MFKRRTIIIKMILIILLFSSDLYAGVSPAPSVIHYQAQLKDADGLNVDKTAEVQIWVYSSATDGVLGDLNDKNLLYAERHGSMKIDRGKLRVSIGEGEGLGKFVDKQFSTEQFAKSQDLFLQLVIDNEVIEPRQRLGGLSSSFKAEHAKVAENVEGEFTIDPDGMPLVDASKITGIVPLARIPTTMSVSKVVAPISNDQIPRLTLDRLTSGTLNPALIGGIDKSSVTGGKFPTSAIKNAMTNNDYFISSGVASHNQYLKMPSQFTQDECSIYVGLQSVDLFNPRPAPDTAYIDDLYIWADYMPGNYYRINCQYGYGTAGQADDLRTSGSCKAGYIIFCTK